jgi:hypothetical protein
MARIDVDIDVDDMLWDMNRHERQEMADKLYDDDIIPSELQDMADELDSRLPETNLEQELSRLLDAVWDNRMFITEEHKEVLRIIAKKGL